MPTPRKSIAELIQSGTLGKNVGRYQSRIASRNPVIAPIGKPPAHLPAPEQAIWAEVVKDAPPGLLTKSDRASLEVLCRRIGRMRSVELKTSELNSLFALLGKFGMTPGDRLKMNLEPLPEPKAKAEENKRMAQLNELD